MTLCVSLTEVSPFTFSPGGAPFVSITHCRASTVNLKEVQAHASDSTNAKDCQSVTPCCCIITHAHVSGCNELSNLNFLNHALNAHMPQVFIQTQCWFTSLKYSAIHPLPSEQSNKKKKIKPDPMPYIWNQYDLQPG